MSTEPATGPAPGTSDFVSLGHRMRWLLAMRIGFALAATIAGLAGRGGSSGGWPGLVASSAAYIVLAAGAELVRRRGRGRRLAILAVEVLLDGLFLSWVTFLTGGVLSPLQLLLYVQVIGISLLSSYRTGLKIAAWDTLLLLTFAYAEASGDLPAPSPLLAGGASSTAPSQILWIMIPTLWGVTIATAVLSAVNERALRRKRADLEALTRMVAELGRSGSADAVPRVLLDSLRSSFDVRRGLVLASPEGDLDVLASLGVDEPDEVPPGMDRVVERALTTRSVQLVRSLDPEHDARLSSIMPDARNVLVVPLYLAGGYRLGVLVAERAGKGERIHRWTVAIVQQFASHAAISLHNAWLLDDNREKLEDIRRLRDELLSKNLTLEARVIERTHELSESLEELRGSNAERRRLLSHLVRAQEDERRRIAGDIHDDPLQILVAVTMRLDMLRRELADAERSDGVSELREMVRAAIEKLRNLMFELRPPILDEQGLAAALREHAEQWHLELRLAIDDRFEAEPPAEARLILYRIAQEAFANIRKHSQAATVIVTLEQRGAAFLVRVEDDGVGFQAATVDGSRQGHIGLTSMRERAELAGGGCRIHSLPAGGTTVEFWVPGSVDEATPGLDGGIGLAEVSVRDAVSAASRRRTAR